MKRMKRLLMMMPVFIMFFFIIIQSGASGDNIPSGKDLYNETARFFAGREIPETSKIHSYTKSNFYINYKKEILSGWNKFQKPNLDRIKKWWGGAGPVKYSRKVLYPFSGPDIINALAFFPDGGEFYLFGLEQPGTAPDPHAMSANAITAGLTGIKISLGTIFYYNFFKTNSMAVELVNNSFNSIAGLMIFFLSLNEYEILDINRIALDADGMETAGIPSDNSIAWENPPKSQRVPGIEIVFKKNGGLPRKVKYFMVNILDSSLAFNAPKFLPYLTSQGPFSTIIKSASYLMHNDKAKFTKIRSAILESSDLIVQDDSGIPLRYFPSSHWKVQLHGYYDRPIDLFSNSLQKDLREAMKKYSTGVLPFSYGYHFKEGESNLLSAEKLKD